MDKNQIFTELETLWEAFKAEHESTKKIAGGRARKAIGEMKKLVTPYRQASVEAGKL
jgi:hypothetical protein